MASEPTVAELLAYAKYKLDAAKEGHRRAHLGKHDSSNLEARRKSGMALLDAEVGFQTIKQTLAAMEARNAND